MSFLRTVLFILCVKDDHFQVPEISRLYAVRKQLAASSLLGSKNRFFPFVSSPIIASEGGRGSQGGNIVKFLLILGTKSSCHFRRYF